MYVAGYIKIDRIEGETNFSNAYGGYSHLFLNEGDGKWRDISKDAGVWRQHNTFLGLFADLDNDQDSDLIIAQDTGKVEMYSNNGDLTFSPIENPSDFSYPHNDGSLKFNDTAEKMNAARYGFGWGVVFADMNLDGREDLLAAQNYARFPANNLLQHYPGKILQNYGKILQNYGDGFKPVEKTAGATNRLFGIAPVVSDFNQDGWPDLVWANLDGESLAYVNQGGHDSWIKVRLPNTASSINARVIVKDSQGGQQIKQFITSQGLGSDQGRDLIFGFGETATAESIRIESQDGTVRSIEKPEMASIITVEGR